MSAELAHCFTIADQDPSVGAIILASNPSSNCFCAGADLSPEGGLGGDDSPDLERRDTAGRVTLSMWQCRKPILAAMHGHSIGVGITMPLAADIRIVYKKAKVGFVFTRRGLIPEGCSTYFLPRLVGMGKATEWVMQGKTFVAEEEKDSGLFTKVVDTPEEVLPLCEKMAEDMLKNNSRISLALSRYMLWRGQAVQSPFQAHLLESRALNLLLEGGEEPREGFMSFLEKRQAQFPGNPNNPSDLPPTFLHSFPVTPAIDAHPGCNQIMAKL